MMIGGRVEGDVVGGWLADWMEGHKDVSLSQVI